MRIWPHRLIEMASVGWRGQAWHNLCHFCHFWNLGMKSARAVTFSIPDLIPFSSLVRSIMILAMWFSCNVLFWFFLCGLHEIGQKKKKKNHWKVSSYFHNLLFHLSNALRSSGCQRFWFWFEFPSPILICVQLFHWRGWLLIMQKVLSMCIAAWLLQQPEGLLLRDFS